MLATPTGSGKVRWGRLPATLRGPPQEDPMPTYVRLVRMTEQGLRSASRMDELIADAHRVWEASGVKIVQAFATLGDLPPPSGPEIV